MLWPWPLTLWANWCPWTIEVYRLSRFQTLYRGQVTAIKRLKICEWISPLRRLQAPVRNQRNILQNVTVRGWVILGGIFKATPTILIWTFFTTPVIATRRRSGAPSKVYRWLVPRYRTKNSLRYFAHHSLIFTRDQKVRNLASIFDTSCLWTL